MATLKMVAIPMLTGLSSTACVGSTFDHPASPPPHYVWCISNTVAAHHLALDTRLFVVHKVGMPDEPGALFDKPLGGVDNVVSGTSAHNMTPPSASPQPPPHHR